VVVSNAVDVTYDIPNKKPITQKCTTGYLYTVDIGELSAGQSFDMTFARSAKTPTNGSTNYFVCKVNKENLQTAYSQIQNNGILNVIDHTESYIKAEIDLTTDFIFTSIPYDKNWKIEIDGIPAGDNEIFLVGNAYIGIKTSQGHHEITFTYKQTELYTGIIVSAIAICILFSIAIIEKKKGGFLL
jgi:uncharacterized membrane protein YfhO